MGCYEVFLRLRSTIDPLFWSSLRLKMGHTDIIKKGFECRFLKRTSSLQKYIYTY